jgi:hypothetical protein
MNVQTHLQDMDDKSVESDDLIHEVHTLRSVVADLTEQREADRRSILILQSQIDNMRDAKCSDSFESVLRNAGAMCSALWSRVPSVPLDDILHNLRRRAKKTGKVSSKSSSCSKKAHATGTSVDRQIRRNKGSVFELNNSLTRGT